MMSVNEAMKLMDKNRAVSKAKGTFGEVAVLSVMQSYQELNGGILIHSFQYPYASNRSRVTYPGNIHLVDGDFVEVKSSVQLYDEIDIVYITKHRIFAIECKARSGTWRIYNKWCSQNGTQVDKSPLAQAEKHVRHLYHNIYDAIPDGNPDYIIPMTVFVDKVRVLDSRNDFQKFYIPIAVVDGLKKKINDCCIPLEYSLDVEYVLARMMKIGKGKVYR
jgi:hypothetical protein